MNADGNDLVVRVSCIEPFSPTRKSPEFDERITGKHAKKAVFLEEKECKGRASGLFQNKENKK